MYFSCFNGVRVTCADNWEYDGRRVACFHRSRRKHFEPKQTTTTDPTCRRSATTCHPLPSAQYAFLFAIS